MLNWLTGLLAMVPFALMGVVALLIVHNVLIFWENYDPKEASTNFAWAIRRCGVLLAIGIGLSGVMVGGSINFLTDLWTTGLYSLALTIFVLISLYVNDHLILSGVDNTSEIKKGNVAVALVEFGGLMATGLVAKGAMIGEGSWVAALVFFILGQAAMVFSVKIYNLVRGGALSLSEEAEHGNTAAGILLGSKLWAYGLIMSAAVSGDFTAWLPDIMGFAATAVMAMVLLYIAEWVVDWVIITWDTVHGIVEKKAIPSALVLAGGKIGVAYVISTIAL